MHGISEIGGVTSHHKDTFCMSSMPFLQRFTLYHLVYAFPDLVLIDVGHDALHGIPLALMNLHICPSQLIGLVSIVYYLQR
jgi:hypothetical protein